MKKIEHIGIAVKELTTAIPLFEKLLNSPCYKIEEVEREQVKTAFFRVAESKIELVAPTSDTGTIHKFIEKNGEGMHHIAFQVENLEEEIERLQREGFRFVDTNPKEGADNKMVCFLHPKSTNGVLIELVAEKK